MKSIIKPRYLGVLVLFVAAGVALGLAVSGGRSSNPPAAKADAARKAQPDRLTKKVVACGRSGKTICDPTAYKRDRSEGLLALSKPDPHGARPRALRQILPPAWRGKDYGAELMTYGEAHKIAPGLAGASSTLVNPSRKVWVLSLYHHPPISVSDTSWSLPAGVAPRMVRVRVESKTTDALTGQAIDSCINCSAVPAPIHYQPEGISLSAPHAGYRPPLSRTAVLALYRRWPAGPHLKGKPTVKLWTVRDGHPAHGEYPAWVVTFHHTRPTSYGIASVSQKRECDFVSIYDLRTRVWTEDFQNCPNHPATRPSKTQAGGAGSSCDSGCTPANQPALDAAANYAETVAGDAHRFTGVEVDDSANKVIVYLTHAPQSVIDQLDARHPGIYVIHNDAPRTLRVLTTLERAFNFSVLKPEGIQVVSVGPTVTGYLQVGVTSKVAVAQAKLDQIYGPNIIRVNKQSMPIGWGYSGKAPTPKVSAIRSTQASLANAAEARQWRKKPLAVADGNDPSVLHLVLRGDGCEPIGTSARLQARTLTLFLHPTSGACTTQTRLYEVTINFAKPIVNFNRIRRVVADYGEFGRQAMKLAVVIAG